MSKNGFDSVIMNGYTYSDDECLLYVKDYQGNVRAVIGHAGNLLEVNNYYPYGALMGGGTVGNNPSVQPCKYGAKELDRQNGLDLYDFEARQQDPMLPCFTTIDPLAEKYYSISPYAYCAGNPILFVDPNGMDTWKLDKQGNVIEIHNQKDYDSFQIVDEDGSIIESTQYSYGTIRKVNDNNVTSYEVQESGNGEQLFRFLASNSNVEWGQIKTSTDENSSDFLLCSKDPKSVAITTDYITEHCAGRMINEINHSHPDGVETPTGLMEGVNGDIQAASSICCNLGYAPKFSIFSPVSGNRVPFSPNSSSSDFPGADKGEVSISMREVTKTAPSLFKRETLLNHLRLHLP